MKNKISLFVLLLFSATAFAQKNGRQNINQLCGCFEVEFKYAETFSPDSNYLLRRSKIMHARELAVPIEQTDKKVVIQHLLIGDDSTIIKHWREDWVYEQPYIWKFEGDRKWVKELLQPAQYKGKWAQTVWEVDDAPRYQGVGDWLNTDGKTFWLNTTDAPLPRREYTTRNDYNVMRRTNRLVVAADGYVHEQDNEKIVKESRNEKLIAQEKGLNTYRRIADANCANAETWWANNSGFWKLARTAWEELFKRNETVQLQFKIEGKRLDQYLSGLESKWNQHELSAESVMQEVNKILMKFSDSSTTRSVASHKN